LPNATLFHFGILTSTFHNAWTRAVCGRLESRYRYSNTIVYNNFVWPNVQKAQVAKIEAKAQEILNARAAHPNASLAELYNPLTIPADLAKAHKELDKAVDAAYGFKSKGKTEAERVAFLFELYQKLTAPIVEIEQVKPKRSRTKKATE
jgi:hypothetical protein